MSLPGRRLRVAVCAGPVSDRLRARLEDQLRAVDAVDFDLNWIDVDAIPGQEADRRLAGRYRLVIVQRPSQWVDATIGDGDPQDQLALDRLVPWVTKCRVNRRAPRAQVAQLFDHDPAWTDAATRLIARLERVTAGHPLVRIDHIGSTSIAGIRAKDLIDIQITVPTFADAFPMADAATAAGFVHVSGPLSGRDRDGNLHAEEVCVDADPGRPVDTNIRPAHGPVARDALLFRDWLRANSGPRRRYEAFKEERVGRPIDEYGDAKEPFISACLEEAERWATAVGWAGFDPATGMS